VTTAAAIAGPSGLLTAANPPRTAAGKRIGFVDLNLDNFHANVFLQALRGPLASRGFTLTACAGLQAKENRAWADKNQILYLDLDDSLDASADFFMVLAPSNPEAHLELCQRVLPFKKPTYVDKTFAPDLATARKIFALADEHGTPIQTSSALRYTNIQDEVRQAAPSTVEHMITWGGGGSFDEYAIHPLELLISVMGHEATALRRRGTPERAQLLIDFSKGRTGVANVFAKTNTPFAASYTTDKATRYVEVDVSKIFVNNMAAVLDFFAAGKANVDRRESLTLMRILDAARNPRAIEGFELEAAK
jgi:predicted dehydrogenase